MEYGIWHLSFCLCSSFFPNFHNSFKRESNLNKDKRKESHVLIEVLPPEHSYGHCGVNQNPAAELMFPVNRVLCSKPRNV